MLDIQTGQSAFLNPQIETNLSEDSILSKNWVNDFNHLNGNSNLSSSLNDKLEWSWIDGNSYGQYDYDYIQKQLSDLIKTTLNKLNFESSEVHSLSQNLITELANKLDVTIEIDSTDDDELLAYWQWSDTFYNVLIDEDGFVELLFLPRDRKKSKNLILDFDAKLNSDNIISAFNDMQSK